MNEESGGSEKRGIVAGLRAFPTWKKIVLGASSLLLLAGLGLTGYERVAGTAAGDRQRDIAPRNIGADGESPLVGRSDFFPEDGPAGDREADGGALRAEDGETYSPALLKGGLSFFVGFCCGYAVRAFLKVTAIVAGVVLLVIFGLSYAGWLTVEWAVMEGHFNNVVATLKGQAGDFQSFITGSLPSAGMAGLGLFTGLKKN